MSTTKETQPRSRLANVISNLALFAGLIAFYVVMSLWVLPRLGFET